MINASIWQESVRITFLWTIFIAYRDIKVARVIAIPDNCSWMRVRWHFISEATNDDMWYRNMHCHTRNCRASIECNHICKLNVGMIVSSTEWRLVSRYHILIRIDSTYWSIVPPMFFRFFLIFTSEIDFKLTFYFVLIDISLIPSNHIMLGVAVTMVASTMHENHVFA